jgi:nucleotide-binding universal stress UspA family protein
MTTPQQIAPPAVPASLSSQSVLEPPATQVKRVSRAPAAGPDSIRLAPRQPIERILVPTDFSSGSAKAVALAATLAVQCDASLTLLHVIDINAAVPSGLPAAAESLMQKLWSVGFGKMTALQRSLINQNLDAQTAVVEGLPWEQVVERSSSFDLIVLSNRRSKHRHFFSRHTLERILENAECPVILVGGPD